MPTPRPWALLAPALFAMTLVACFRDEVEQAAEQAACPWWGCAGDNICLTNTRTCVRPCEGDADCPGGFLCKGFFRDVTTFSGRGRRFCRKAEAGEGMACDQFNRACAGELICVDGLCRRRCEADGACGPANRCLLTVLSSDSLAPGAVYRVCVRATTPVGEPCRPNAEPYCAKGAVCLDELCRRECANDNDCPKGFTCAGRGYSGWRGRLRSSTPGGAPDFRYCAQ